MERQAIRRVDQGDLTDEQIEQVGSTLMAPDSRMSELSDYFGVAREDLNLDLGPLGRPRQPPSGRPRCTVGSVQQSSWQVERKARRSVAF
jgi:hypothetical protein